MEIRVGRFRDKRIIFSGLNILGLYLGKLYFYHSNGKPARYPHFYAGKCPMDKENFRRELADMVYYD